MATSTKKPLVNSYTRVFLIEGRARADHKPAFQNCVKAGAPEQSFGDIEKIECPDPDVYGAFEEVGIIQGAVERATISLMGRYAADLASELLRLAKLRCALDLQIHIGTCTKPNEFNTFTKAIVMENAYLTNWSADDLGALASDEAAVVNETVDVSGQTVYELVPLSISSKAADILTNELVDVVIYDAPLCAGCSGSQSDGGNRVYAVSAAAGGSPGTPADLVFSVDAGVNWLAHDIDTMSSTEDPDGVAGLGDYVVVVSNETGSLHYADEDDFKANTDPSWTEISTGFVAAGGPNDISSTGTYAFIVGNGGYIYGTDDPTVGVTVLDAGQAVQDNLVAVSALSNTFAVAVGNAGAIVKTTNGANWSEVTSPVSVAINFTCVWVIDENIWWIGTSGGNLYYTVNGGVDFTLKLFSGSASGVVRDVTFVNQTTGFLAHSTTLPRGRVFRTYDGGYSWNLLPETGGTFPLNDRVTALAVTRHKPNFFVGVGLADDGTDGFIAVGSN